jgi:hypothetical protein
MRAHTEGKDDMGRKAIMVWGRMPLKRNVARSGLIALLLALGALGLAVVGLAATASTASARSLTPWYCPPLPTAPTTFDGGHGLWVDTPHAKGCIDVSLHPGFWDWFYAGSCIVGCGGPFDFGDRRVGTTSPAQRFALVIEGNDFPFGCSPSPCPPESQRFTPSISVSGDYAQTNNCPPTLSPAPGREQQIQGCIITVTFAPTGTGPRRGTLSTGPDADAAAPTVALSGSGVTTRTPPALPLLLHGDGPRGQRTLRSFAKRPFTLHALTNNDSTVVVSGGVKKTTKRLAAGEETKIKAKLNHLKRLKEKSGAGKPDRIEVKIKFAATDEFGQTATEKTKATICRHVTPKPGHDPGICHYK